jgi:replicative DNA helicase
MSEYTDKAREFAQNFGKMQGLSSGYLSIDELTKGFVKGEVTVIAGKTSRGKTTLAMNIANNLALSGLQSLVRNYGNDQGAANQPLHVHQRR